MGSAAIGSRTGHAARLEGAGRRAVPSRTRDRNRKDGATRDGSAGENGRHQAGGIAHAILIDRRRRFLSVIKRYT